MPIQRVKTHLMSFQKHPISFPVSLSLLFPCPNLPTSAQLSSPVPLSSLTRRQAWLSNQLPLLASRGEPFVISSSMEWGH